MESEGRENTEEAVAVRSMLEMANELSSYAKDAVAYSVDNDNTKDGDDNPAILDYTTPSQVTKYFLSRSFSKFKKYCGFPFKLLYDRRSC